MKAAKLVIIGVSFTTAAVATTVAISAGVAANEQGMAAALRQTAFQLGVAIGVAVLLSVAASYTNSLLAAASAPSQVGALTAGYRLALAIVAGLSAAGALTAAITLRKPPTPHCYSPGSPSCAAPIRAAGGLGRPGSPRRAHPAPGHVSAAREPFCWWSGVGFEPT
jgi:hypothetical protein